MKLMLLPRGVFFLPKIDSDTNSSTLLVLQSFGGEDIDQEGDGVVNVGNFKRLYGSLKGYLLLEDILANSVCINLLTTLAAQQVSESDITQKNVLERLSNFAKLLFGESVNGDGVIDYKDLYAFMPHVTPKTVLKNPNLLENLADFGVVGAVQNGDDLGVLLQSDADGDGALFLDELLVGTNPALDDSDADGLDDMLEGTLGLDPLEADSDFDGLSDAFEHFGTTDPLQSDSDGDYWPDGFEVANGTNPLLGDENSDGVLDGLEGDPFFASQWHLHSSGAVVNNTKNIATIAGNSLDILELYRHVVGKKSGYGSLVQVVDVGVEFAHEDLEVSLEHSFNAVTKLSDPTPTSGVSTSDKTSPLIVGHGSAVAGILGARANNGKGVRGVVPYARIAGSNWLEEQSLAELERVWFSMKEIEEIGVSNNSWGGYFVNDLSFEEIMEFAAKEHRGGKGKIFVFAAGNEREEFGNANLSNLINNRFAIAVAALNHKNEYASYSNPGSNILVSAYGGERYYEAPTIATTLLMGESYYVSELDGLKGAVTFDADESKNYTYAMNGTSAAAPMVSGAIALVLEACSDLTYRDMRWLIAKNAKLVDSSHADWIENSAGLKHNVNYGFGLINPRAMVDACRSKYYEHLPLERYGMSEQNSINQPLPDNNTTVSYTLIMQENLTAEWVGLWIDSDHVYSGDLVIDLISPSGTKTSIVTPNEVRFDGYNGGFRFGSVAFMGEPSKGVWRVNIRDALVKDSGILKGLKLEIYGH